jgi:hypothetical protein
VSTQLDHFEVLHQARIRGLAPLEELGDVGELVDASLLLVTERGAMLTPAGLARHEELLAAWREAADIDELASAYERFLAVNRPVKEACSRWQTQGDEEDALFVTVDALAGIVQRVKPALRRAGNAIPRFTTYAARLEAAVEAAGAGDGRFITDPRVDSVHSIWFECHEDFLVVLGRSREEEGSY